MSGKLDKEKVRAWKKNWEAINALEAEELRAMTPDEKLRQLAALMESVDAMGWRDELEEGVEEVRERWHRIRSRYRHGAR